TCGGATPNLCGLECVNQQTDPKHCGRCNHDCLGGGCFVGACQATSVVTGAPNWFVVDSTYVYFRRLGVTNPVLSRVRQDGTGLIDLFTGNGDLGPMAIDST